MKTILFVFSLILLTIGCVQVPSTASTTLEEYDSEKGDSIYVEGNYIIANVSLQTPNPCYEIKPNVTTNGSVVDFVISLESTLGVFDDCAAVIGTKAAKIKYGPVNDGYYSVKFLALYPNTGWAAVTWETEAVQVPPEPEPIVNAEGFTLTNDAGKSCTDTDECEGRCSGADWDATSGQCSEFLELYGCSYTLHDGVVLFAEGPEC